MSLSRSFVVLLGAATLAAIASPALAQSYSFQTVKLAGALTTNPTGFGPSGTIGYAVNRTAKTLGFVQAGSLIKTESVPGAAETELFGYANGIYVGFDGNAEGSNSVGFMSSSSGPVETIAFPGSSFTDAFGINSAHTVVGTYGALVGPTQFLGFTYTGGVFTTIEVPNAEYTEVTGINDSGVLAGWSEGFSTSPIGFVIQNGHFTTISPPGSIETFVNGINNKNQVVGYYKTSPQNGFTGFVYDGTSYTDIVDPAGTSTYAYGINDAGQVAGFTVTKSGDIGYIATPAAATAN